MYTKQRLNEFNKCKLYSELFVSNNNKGRRLSLITTSLRRANQMFFLPGFSLFLLTSNVFPFKWLTEQDKCLLENRFFLQYTTKIKEDHFVI